MGRIGQVAWNKGLTKDDDDRIKKYSINVRNTLKRRGIKPPLQKGFKHSSKTREKMSINRSGNNHWNWQGGKTKLRNKLYHTIKYHDWRRKVFERDNYTCRECGVRNGFGKKVVLQAHHRKEVYKILKENNIKTLEQALSCVELWDINNGDTLCDNCHRKTFKFIKNQYI